MTYSGTLFGIPFTIDPVAFTLPILGGWSVYWYGVIIAAGFLACLIFGMKFAPRLGINVDRMLDVVLITTPLAILCARAYYIIFDGEMTFRDFFDFSGSGFSGLAIYGGVIGAFGIGLVTCKLFKMSILDMFDLAGNAFLLGQAFGRWGNFINQEAYGAFTGSSWWGMQSDRTVAEMGEGLVHPCFLYESIWCLAGFFLLASFLKKRKFKGQIILSYGVWYGLGRAVIETLRTDSLMLGAFRVSCLLSILLVLVCGILLLFFYRRSKAAALEPGYGQVFRDNLEEAIEEEREKEEAEGEEDEKEAEAAEEEAEAAALAAEEEEAEAAALAAEEEAENEDDRDEED